MGRQRQGRIGPHGNRRIQGALEDRHQAGFSQALRSAQHRRIHARPRGAGRGGSAPGHVRTESLHFKIDGHGFQDGQDGRRAVRAGARQSQENFRNLKGAIMDKTQAAGQQAQPYLFFDGKCEEAINFYKSALGAKVDMLMRFKDSPEPVPPGMCPPGSDDKVMHAALRIGDTVVMASDGMAGGHPEFKGFSLSVNAKNEAEADKVFGALGKGGKVVMPLGKTFYSPRFGMVTDKFGVGWMVIV